MRPISSMSWVALAVLVAACPKPPKVVEVNVPDAPEPVTFTETGYELTRLETMRPRTTEVFAPYIASEDAAIRVRAARSLGRAGEAQQSAAAPFVEALKPMLEDEHVLVRREAAAALGIIGEPAAGVFPDAWPRLTDLETRQLAIRGMGRIAPVEVEAAQRSGELALLVKLLDSPALGEHAAIALGVYGWRAQRAGVEKPWVPETAAAALSRRFRGGAGDTRWAFGYALYRLKVAEAVEDFTLGLADPNPSVRAVSARGLGALAHVVILRDNLQKTLGDRDTLVAIEAARALGQRKLSGAIAITDLLDLVADANREDDPSARHVAVAAADALASLGAREATEAIGRQLRPARAFLFPNLVTAYVASGGDACVPVLRELLEKTPTGEPRDPPPGVDPSWWRRQAIAQALAAGAIEEEEEGKKPVALIELAEELLEDTDGRVRWAAASSYAELMGEDGTETLIGLLDDDDPAVVAVAADKLGAWKVETAADAIAERLGELADADPETAVTLVQALASIGREQDLALIRPLVDSPRRALALTAMKVLRDAGEDVGGTVEGIEPWGFPRLPEFVASQDLLRAEIVTTKGPITLHLFPRQAPLTVLNFARLARRGFYEDIVLHRVVPGFVAQAGCPRSDGWGGPGYGIPCELNTETYAPGTVGMALAGRDTGGSQFFIALTPQPHLEANYTVFGRVVRGMDTVYRLERGDRILSIEVP